MRRHRPLPRMSFVARGFTLTELLVVIAIVGVLAVIMIPVVGGIREHGFRAESRSNLRQCLLTFRLVSDDNRGVMPYVTKTNTSWIQLLWPYAYPGRAFPAWETDSSNLEGTFFYCPGIRYVERAEGQATRPFATNTWLHSSGALMDRLRLNALDPSRTMLLATGTTSSVLLRTQIGFRFGGGTLANIGYVDGHVETLSRTQMKPYIDSYENVFWKGGL